MTEEEVKAAEEAAKAAVEAAGSEAKSAAEAKGASADEVRTAVERARKEEKDKLYPQLEALREGLKEVQEALRAEKEEKETIKAEALAEAEKQRQASLSSEERVLEAVNKLEEQLARERTAREKLEKEATENLRRVTLADYKRRAIETAKDEILPELVPLVQGQTEAEIDAAIANAKARTTEIVARFKAERGADVRTALSGPADPNTAALEEQELQERIGNIDPERYKSDPAYRQQILDKAVPAMYRSGH